MNKSQIKQARQADLAEYLLSVGVPLVKQGNRYRHKEHDSLVFTKNSYYWNSMQEHGNSIDYLVRHMEMDFRGAVIALTGVPNVDEIAPVAFNAHDLQLNADTSKVRRYLNKDRHIGRGIIKRLEDSKLILQEKRTNNAVFPIYDENNVFVGAELQGIILNKRFKGVKSGSKYGYGFNVRFSDNDTYDYALFFESAVDLLSFIDVKIHFEKKSLDRCILISMSGVKEIY